jgi:uncharacterized protein YndB with AHSA1/START domain
MLRKLLLVVLLLVVVILGLATRQPDTFSVERRLRMAAPPERIFSQINDFHAWDAWSPWAKLDPAMKATYGGAPNGVGAVYDWSGNSEVGSGRMTIKSSTPPSEVTIALDFLTPIESHNVTTFMLTPADGGTDVLWSMKGNADYVTKLMTMFASMDKMVGPDFERGLQQLKAVVERSQ